MADLLEKPVAWHECNHLSGTLSLVEAGGAGGGQGRDATALADYVHRLYTAEALEELEADLEDVLE